MNNKNHSEGISEPETKSVVSNISESDFINQLAERRVPKEAPTEEQEPEIPVEDSKEIETDNEILEENSEVSEGKVSEDDVLSQFDLDSMSSEQIIALGEKLKNKAVSRYGELTSRRKAAEEELARFKESIATKESNPLEVSEEIKDNPFSNITTIEGLRAQAKEVNNIIEWGEDIIFKSDDFGANDIVAEVEGKSFTKVEVREHVNNARKSRDKFLPAQLQTIQSKEQGVQLKEAFTAKAKDELSWMNEEQNDTKDKYEAMVNDPRFQKLETALDPEVAAQLPYIIAHAANSIYGSSQPSLKATKAESTRLTPPQSPSGVGSKFRGNQSTKSKELESARARLKKSGKMSDFITLRTLQRQK